MLDAREEKSAPAVEPTTPDAVDAPSLLVIDDDTVHRMILCKVAARAGFTATGAATYEEAVKLLEEHQYTLISLDLSLGEHGGVEILHVIAALDCKTPIIIVSGSNEAIRDETVNLAHLLSLNVCRSLPKPVDLPNLRRLLLDIKERKAVGLTPCCW